MLEQGRTMAQPIRVLIADDSARAREGLCALLTTWLGVEVVGEASNGQEALDLVAERRPDVVLMDVQMPVMDGLSATRAIRAREAETGRRRLPVIAVTANAMPHHVEECLAAGMDAHISKPIRAADLFDTISRLLAPDALDAAQAA